MLLVAIIVAGLAVLLALGVGYWLMRHPSVNTAQNNIQLTGYKEFKSSIYGYTFMYPPEFTGGVQKLSDALQKVGIRESVVFQAPQNATEHFAILASVEEPTDIAKGVEFLADSYETGLKNAGLIFVRTASTHQVIDGVDVLKRTYDTQKSNVVHNTVFFVVRGTRLYVISLLRTTNSADALAKESGIVGSIHFTQ